MKGKIARMRGYMDGVVGAKNKFAEYFNRGAYDHGYQDGAIMRAVRTGDLSRINPAIPRHLTAPRLMVADDISATGDGCREFLREAEKRKMKENAFYYLQYYLAMNAPLKIPDIYAEMAREIFGKEPSEGERKIGKSAVLGMGYDPASRPDQTAFPTKTGRFVKPHNPPIHNLPSIPKSKCGQCEGSGVIRGGLGGDGQDEPCPVCDGSGRLP